MKHISTACKVALSTAALIVAVALLIAVLKFDSRDLRATGVAHRKDGWINYVFSQSRDGKILYVWDWSKRDRKWKRRTHRSSR